MKNIELKIAVGNFNKIILALRKAKAKHFGRLRQIDIYYRCKSGRLKLRSVNDKNYELIFYRRSNRKNSKISDYHIFAISPKQANDLEAFLNKSFGRQVMVKKKRDLWIYKNTRIHLDNVYRLGKFLELETVVKGNNLKKAKEEFIKVIKLLNLSAHEKESKSYSDLLK